MIIKKPDSYSLRNTVFAHGWFQLAPFLYDDSGATLSYVVDFGGNTTEISIRETGASLNISFESSRKEIAKDSVTASVRHVLRLDEPFSELHSLIADSKSYDWIKKDNLGPMLRSATVFEDLVKTICTTNCSWGLTKAMTTNLVASLGSKSKTGKRAFPTPAAMASQSEVFYKDEIRAGYRGPYLLELAEAAASGKIDPESWLDSELPTSELKKSIKKIRGVGDYAAEHILKLIGRYDGLALDSFLRSSFYKHYNKGGVCPDKTIERKYRKFGGWQGLVIWFDMVRKESQEGS